MDYEHITEKVIACAFTVFNQMDSGYLASLYENRMLIELRKTGLSVESQQPITVRYQYQIIGHSIADFLVEDLIIVELKAVSRLTKIRAVQLVIYLISTGKDVGILINSG